jgi:uracil-DNA glycosylase family 4
MITVPAADCSLCPRLVQFRSENACAYPHFYNGAVASFGELSAALLIVGLAPGLKGANATGRPFTGDYAGEVLYPALLGAGLAVQGAEEYTQHTLSNGYITEQGEARSGGVWGVSPQLHEVQRVYLDNYDASPAPHQYHPASLTLINTRITNAVRCVPPENKPTPQEITGCNPFLKAEIAAMPQLRVILTLGQISHQAVLKALGQKLSAFKFGHAAMHQIGQYQLINTYHTSRYNMNTGRLTEAMFAEIIAKVAEAIKNA